MLSKFKTKSLDEWMVLLVLIILFTLPSVEIIKQISITFLILIGIYLIIKNRLIIDKDIGFYIFIALVISSIISSFFAFDQIKALSGCKDILRLALTFIIIRALVLKENTYLNFLLILIFGFLLTISYGYYEYLSGTKIHIELNSVGHVNHSSIYILQILIISLAILLFTSEKLTIQNKFFFISVFIVTLITIFITGSRATMYTSLSILFLLMLYKSFVSRSKYIIIIFFCILFLAFLIVILNDNTYVLNKFLIGFSDPARYSLLLASVQGWLNNNILFGIGVGNADFVIHMSHPHNTYLSYLLERGLMGLLLYLAFMIYILKEMILRLKLDKNNIYLIIAIALWIMNFVTSFANTVFHHENAQLMVIIWALALNKSLQNKDNNKQFISRRGK